MSRDETARRPSVLQRLFAERHVYLRSGPESRYVRISSGLQLAVTLLFLVAIAALAATSYSSVVNHLEAAEHSREVARLEGVNKSLLAATDAARSSDALRATSEQPPVPARQIEEAEASRSRAEELAAAAKAEADELRRELELVRGQLEGSSSQLAVVEAEREALTTLLNTQAEAGAGEGEEQSAALEAEVADLTAERAALEAELDQLRESSGTARAELDTALAQIETLTNEMEQGESERADAVDTLEVRVATLQAEKERLNDALTEVRAERHDLASQVQEARAGGGEEQAVTPDELERLQSELEAAQKRIAELEQTRDVAAITPSAGPSSDSEEVARLEKALADAERRVAELEERTAARPDAPSLQRRPAVGDEVMASDFAPAGDEEEGVGRIAPATGYQNAASAVAALEAAVTAANQLADSLAEAESAGANAERIADLRAQMETARERTTELSETITRLSRRDVALQQALVTLAPLPPPPAPR
jgi:chromosome segregation ATPase